MNEPNLIPSTMELITRLRSKRSRTVHDKVDSILAALIALIFGTALTVACAKFFGLIGEGPALRGIGVFLVSVSFALAAVWIVNQFIQLIRMVWRAYAQLAEDTDRKIAEEQIFIQALLAHSPAALKDRSKHLEIAAKRLRQHVQRMGLLAALGVVLVNMNVAGEKATLWPRFDDLPLFIYAGGVGIALGSIGVLGLVSMLDRLASLLAMAAEKATTTSQ